MFKKIFQNFKEHWILYLSGLIIVILLSSGLYYVINGGQQGLTNQKANRIATQRAWKQNDAVNENQTYKNKIAPVNIVRQAVQDKFGNTFDYAKNFKSINNFIEKKFNKNTAKVIANNTELVIGMSQQERNSAISNIKAMTTKEYQGQNSKSINVNFQTGKCYSQNNFVSVSGNNVYASPSTSFVNDDGALVGMPIVITTQSNQADKNYPYYQLEVYYSPNDKGDITINHLEDIANDLNISSNGKRLNPVFTDLINNPNQYSGELNDIYSKIANYKGYTVFQNFNAQNLNNAKPTMITMQNAKANGQAKLISNSFYVLTYEIPKTAFDNTKKGGSINISIDDHTFTLVQKQSNSKIELGGYSINE